jgi:hypothetical protein
VKSFLYLDEAKLHSFSAQAFEQGMPALPPAGPERRVALEQGFLRFEAWLAESGALDGEEPSFAKARGKAIITDVPAVAATISRFNELGEALTYVTNHNAIEQAKNAFEAAQQLKDRNKKAVLSTQLRQATDIKKLAREAGLQQDADFLRNLQNLLAYGYGDHIEIRVTPGEGGQFFTSVLDRAQLRDAVPALVRKYSRYTQQALTVVGLVTQRGDRPSTSPLPKVDAKNIKEGVAQIVSLLADVERQFTGIAEEEIVLDPIAIYREA